ncbi:MAG: MOSC N-terminal beta barrel domain-containing protein, partial [Dongiaceae bacterium]
MPPSPADSVGAIGTIFRYPVKSMRGEVLDEAAIDDDGVLGDRAYALIDRETGRVASAKLPKKWGGLLELSARFMTAPRRNSPAPAVKIEWPDGTHVASDVGDPDGKLSETLGRRVTLTTTRPDSVSVERLDPLDPAGGIRDIGHIMLRGKFADYAPIHLLTTATLAQLSAL